MTKTRREFSLTATDYRVFVTLFELEKENKYSKPQGLVSIFLGENEYNHLLAFNTLKNISSKRLAMRMKILLRKNYLGLKYSQEENDIYYCLKELGKIEAIKYIEKHKCPFKKAKPEINKDIVLIK